MEREYEKMWSELKKDFMDGVNHDRFRNQADGDNRLDHEKHGGEYWLGRMEEIEILTLGRRLS